MLGGIPAVQLVRTPSVDRRNLSACRTRSAQLFTLIQLAWMLLMAA